jgi:uncharacterized OB-fold protein
MPYRTCPDCGVVFFEHRHYEAPERCPRCFMRTGTVVELIRHGYSRRFSAAKAQPSMSADKLGVQVEG